MAVATPRLYAATMQALVVVSQVAQAINDEFATGGAVSLNPMSMLTPAGVQLAKTVAEVKPACGYGNCVHGATKLLEKLGELFGSALSRRMVSMQSASGRGTFQVSEQVRRTVPGTAQGWGIHVAVELVEGGVILDPTVARIFESRQAWKEWIVGIENSAEVVVRVFN
jgi:hypothetical protein